jgi:cytidyltransferase-like protein
MTASAKQVVVSGAFDNVRSRDIRFLHEASRGGDLTVLLWSDATCARALGQPPKFPEAERKYLLQSLRFVRGVKIVAATDTLPAAGGLGFAPDVWTMLQPDHSAAKEGFCRAQNIACRVVRDEELLGFPEFPATPGNGRKKIIATGCYDWFHSGHVRFFEEVSALGDLYVTVGHDANIRLLKGEGHPLLPEDERRYMVGAVKFVTQALVSTGDGWLDAEPEIRRLKVDAYAVNEDGDKGGKREYCAKMGMEYLVLKRTPAPGLPKRSSTDLRGF